MSSDGFTGLALELRGRLSLAWDFRIILRLNSRNVYCLVNKKRGLSRNFANSFEFKVAADKGPALIVSNTETLTRLVISLSVSLNAFNGHRYISFIMALENENGDFSYNDDLGRFELSDMIETRFSPNCINMVENTNTNSKTHMHLTWVAPSEPGSGCVLIRATVQQHREVWHMDDGGLTKRICEEVTDDVESQPTAPAAVDVPCCACDEARYEVSTYGMTNASITFYNSPLISLYLKASGPGTCIPRTFPLEAGRLDSVSFWEPPTVRIIVSGSPENWPAWL